MLHGPPSILLVVSAVSAVHFTWCYCGTNSILYCCFPSYLLLVSWPFCHITWQCKSCNILSDLQKNRSSHFEVMKYCLWAIYYNLILFIAPKFVILWQFSWILILWKTWNTHSKAHKVLLETPWAKRVPNDIQKLQEMRKSSSQLWW
jgi:hypothetical protein